MPAGYALLRSLTKSSEIPVKATIKGDLPKWLSGTLFRNGPGRFEYGDKTYKHLFDGHSCVHKFRIEDGNVYYSNKLLETQSYTKSLKENRLYTVFGTPDLCSNIFGRFQTFFFSSKILDNVNVNVVPFANEHLYALTETNMICELNPKDLSIKNTLNVRDYFKKVSTTFAHPHVDNDGSWITMGMNMGMKNDSYEFIRYDASHKKDGIDLSNPHKVGKIIASLPSSHKDLSYFHSFGVTKNYIVFLEQALAFSKKKIIDVLVKNKAFSEILVMNPEWKTRIHVIRKDTGEILKQKFITEPTFTFHHINAYENDESELIVDFCAYDPNRFLLKKLSYKQSFTDGALSSGMTKSLAQRIKVPINSKSKDDIYCEMQVLNKNVSFELPTINYSRFNGLKYKYMYGVNISKKPFSIVKMNMDNPSEVLEMSYSENERKFLPSEPIFVESPNPTSEDDGVVLVMVLADNNDFLSVLDAKTLKEIARAEIPEDVKGAFTFHGFFADSKTFAQLN